MIQDEQRTRTDGQELADEGNEGAAGGGTQADADTGGEGTGEAAPEAPEPAKPEGGEEGGEG